MEVYGVLCLVARSEVHVDIDAVFCTFNVVSPDSGALYMSSYNIVTNLLCLMANLY